MARHWCSWIQWVLWILNLTAAGTAGERYVPDGAIYVIESVLQSHIERYNILEIDVTFHSPGLKLQWCIQYNSHNLQPVTDEVAEEMGMVIEEYATPEGQVITRLQQKLKHYDIDSYRTTVPIIRSDDGRFLAYCHQVAISNSSAPVTPFYVEPPLQFYVTKQPPAIARWSAHKAAEITAEIWSSVHVDMLLDVWFISSEAAESPFASEHRLYSNHGPSMTTAGVNVTVQDESIGGLVKHSITVQTQRSGLIMIFLQSIPYYRLGSVSMFTDSITQMEDSWLDNRGYSVRFRRPDPEEVERGLKLFLECDVAGENLSPQMVEMRLNGRKLAVGSYRRVVPGYLYVLYQTNGSEEGEFECRYEDEATGVVESAFKSVTRA